MKFMIRKYFIFYFKAGVSLFLVLILRKNCEINSSGNFNNYRISMLLAV